MTTFAARFPHATFSSARLATLLAAVFMLISATALQPLRALPEVPGAGLLRAGQISLPLQFAAAPGQPGAGMVAEGPAGSLEFAPAGVTLTLPPVGGQPAGAVQLRFEGATTAGITGGERLEGVLNLYLGSDPAGWRTNIPTYAGIVYHELYPGIDLTYEGRDGALKGTYLVAPGADPASIRWHYAGATEVRVSDTGDLLIGLPGGALLTEAAPVVWQVIDGRQVPVAARYSVDGARSISFTLAAYDPAHALTIDPTLSYGTFVGGAGDDWGQAVAVDGAGNVIITGYTYSTQFPGTTGSRASTNAFVTKLNAAGTAVLFSTQIGGGEGEQGKGVAVDGQGNVWVTGHTESSDLPTVSPIQNSFSGGNYDTFVAKLSPAGAILAATYLGDPSTDEGNGIALDPQGNAYIAGTAFAQFGEVATIAKIAASGTAVVYQGTFGAAERGFLQGTSAYGVAVDADGKMYVVGKTNTIAFPVVNPLQAQCGRLDSTDDCDGPDAFVAIVNPAGTELLYSTFLGGDGSDEARGVALDQHGNIYVVGSTFAFDFPTANAFQPTKRGADNFSDTFVTKLNPQGSVLLYSTYLGGTDWEDGNAIAVDGAGNAYVTGLTSSNDLPLASPLQGAISGICFVGSSERYCYDAFATKLDANGGLVWSTYLGGTADDVGRGIAVDGNGNAYVAGHTESHGFPTTGGAFQPSKGMQDDAFVVKIGTGGAEPPPPPGPYRAYVPLVIN